MNNLRIDLGCGLQKKEGTLGIDVESYPGVDHVVDLEKEPLPFADRSVEYVHSSHMLEHIENPEGIFREISRVCIDGAQLEFWTPYNWSNSAFIYGHNVFYNEDHYMHMCVWHSDAWTNSLHARWLLKEFTYVINPPVLVELYRRHVSLDFALRYYKGLVSEFGVFIEVHHNYVGDSLQPRRTFTVDRSAKKYPVKTLMSELDWSQIELEDALEWFSSIQLEQSPPQLQQTQAEKELVRSQLQQAQVELDQLQLQLQHTQVDLQQSQATVNAMLTSKFWKLRTAWFKFKKMVGLPTSD